MFSAHLPWSHQRWLARFARAAAPDVVGTPTRSDAQVLEQWYPRARYLYVTSTDVARQAARWYLGRRAGPATVGGGPRPGQPLDLQEIRWIEALISRQERAWEVYFQVHDIDAHRIEYEDFLAQPGETVAGILRVAGGARHAGASVAGRGSPAAPGGHRCTGCLTTWLRGSG